MPKTSMSIEVFNATSIIVTEGAMTGETLSFADELVMDDVFEVGAGAVMTTLDLQFYGDTLRRAEAGHNPVHIDSCLTLMASDGDTYEVLVLVEVEEDAVAAIFVLPLGELRPDMHYRLVGVARHTATRRFAEAASGSFARGTHIAMADGAMRRIETLKPGDLILTRDAGRQPVRHIGQATLRATGSFAPVVITKGTLHNENDLVLRPDHRIFVYQREDRLGAGRPEVLIKARHLIDNTTVIRRRGGFIDYFQLILDDHHIIYAEGIAAESHLVDRRTRHALPDGIAPAVHAHRPHLDYEVKDNLIPVAQAAALLRKASIS